LVRGIDCRFVRRRANAHLDHVNAAMNGIECPGLDCQGDAMIPVASNLIEVTDAHGDAERWNTESSPGHRGH
jgi:hypothetical protein